MLTKKKKKLSCVPSRAILQALEDIKDCARDRRYKINMGDWHYPRQDTGGDFVVCEVCFAGASMAARYGINCEVDRTPSEMPKRSRRMLEALDIFRLGFVQDALISLHKDFSHEEIPEMFNVCPYQDNEWAFHRDMKAMAAMLKSHGL